MKSNFRTVSHAYYAILIDRKKLQERERFPNATPRNGKLNAKRNETKRNEPRSKHISFKLQKDLPFSMIDFPSLPRISLNARQHG